MNKYLVSVAQRDDPLVPLLEGFVYAENIPSALRQAAAYAELNEPVRHDEQAKPVTGPMPAVGIDSAGDDPADTWANITPLGPKIVPVKPHRTSGRHTR